MIRRPFSRFATLALIALIPAACGGDDDPTGPGGLDEGTFQATVSGDLSLTISGQAGYAAVNLGNGLTGWALTMTPASSEVDGSSIILTHYGSTPTEGSFSLDLNEQTGEGYTLGFTYYDGGAYTGVLQGSGGTIQITDVSGNSMQGTIQATVTGIITVEGEATEVTANINASFSAFGIGL